MLAGCHGALPYSGQRLGAMLLHRAVGLSKAWDARQKRARRKLRAPDLTEISFRITFLTLEAVATPSGLGRKQCFHRPQI
jgi:hypothetical protein